MMTGFMIGYLTSVAIALAINLFNVIKDSTLRKKFLYLLLIVALAGLGIYINTALVAPRSGITGYPNMDTFLLFSIKCLPWVFMLIPLFAFIFDPHPIPSDENAVKFSGAALGIIQLLTYPSLIGIPFGLLGLFIEWLFTR